MRLGDLETVVFEWSSRWVFRGRGRSDLGDDSSGGKSWPCVFGEENRKLSGTAGVS